MVSSSVFARTARETYEQHTVPYKLGGKTLSTGMDSIGFIIYCLSQNGIHVSYRGTNDLYRNGGTQCIPLKEALSNKLVVPGVILLHVEHDGEEPPRYQSDGKGNCDYAAIAISPTEFIYPSQKAGGMIKRPIQLLSGKPNVVLFSKHVDYDAHGDASSPSAPPSRPSVPDDGIYTKTKLRLRKSPSTDSAVIVSIPKGKCVDLLEYHGEWSRVRYRISSKLWHEGWCMSKFLTLD